ncbi:hypothetical protein BGZ65_008207, partial [Modicella reniformis]
MAELAQMKGRLDDFYNNDLSVKKHLWDSRKAADAEFAIITNRLLKMVGGSTRLSLVAYILRD